MDCQSLRRGAKANRPPSARAWRGGGHERQHVDGAHGIGIKGSDPPVYVLTVYAAGRGVYCDEFSTHSDASQRKPAAIPPTIARARESAVLAWGFIA